MQRIYSSSYFIMTALILSSVVLSGCEEKPRIIEQKCGRCHDASIVYKHKRSMDEWDRLIFGMKVRGLKVTSEEEKEIMDVLDRKYSIK